MNSSNFRSALVVLPLCVLSLACGDDTRPFLDEFEGTTAWSSGSGTRTASSTSGSTESTGSDSAATTGAAPPDDDPLGTTGHSSSSDGETGHDTDTQGGGACQPSVPPSELCAALVAPRGGCETSPLFTELQCMVKFEEASSPTCREALLDELLCLTVAACATAPEDICAVQIEQFEQAC